MTLIVIIDYGMGNVGSILNMLKYLEIPAKISSDIDEIETAEKLILPGVGAFDNGMKNLKERGLIDVLTRKVVEEKTPILGICLGVHLFTKSSEEGILPGLGWIDAETKKFEFKDKKLKVPHMGWNTVKIKKDVAIFKGSDAECRFYFVHSYHLVCNEEKDVVATTEYGYEFVSAIKKGNIYGTQFHPEKSHRFGMMLLKNFAELV